MGRKDIRPPAVAGQFYPDDPERLSAVIGEYMNASGEAPAPDRIFAAVVPHAGYLYSGPTAAHAYQRMSGKKPARVVLLGCSHRYRFDTASVYAHGAFDSPLGALPIDEPFAHELATATESSTTEPHLLEHSLEVQIPFLIAALGEVPIVPVLFGSPAQPWHATIGKRIAEMLDQSDLVVISTDLSHYLSEDEANEIDKRSIDTLLTRNWEDYSEQIESGSCAMCGATAVVAGMVTALESGAQNWSLLDYRTSAATSGDYRRVVGYASVSMERGT
jgi:MEMO1 family protein